MDILHSLNNRNRRLMFIRKSLLTVFPLSSDTKKKLNKVIDEGFILVSYLFSTPPLSVRTKIVSWLHDGQDALKNAAYEIRFTPEYCELSEVLEVLEDESEYIISHLR